MVVYQYVIFLFVTFLAAVSCLQCYKCRSDVEEKCAVNPRQNLTVVDCLEGDQCAVRILGTTTHRNCLSRLPGDECTDPLCKTCTTDLCNGEVFPSDRWSCYQCSGSACLNVTQSKLQPLPCPKYMAPDRCFTNIIGIHNIVRGCVSGEEKLCPNICLKCDTVGCNSEQGVFESKCQSCQWMPGPSMYPKDFACKRNQIDNGEAGQCTVARNDSSHTCTQKVLLGHREKCFTHWNPLVNVVVRGCSSRMGHYPSGKLWECNGDNCNSDCIPTRCNVCDAETNPACRNNTRVLQAQDCPSDNFSCFSCEDKNKKLTRGCGFRRGGYDSHCYNCQDEDGCNLGVVRSCYKCTSTEDLNCARWIDTRRISKVQCKHHEDKCVVTKTADYVVRGCESEVRECTEGDPNCRRCDGTLCNYGEYER